MSSAFRLWSSLISVLQRDESDDKGVIGKNAVSDGLDAHSALGYISVLAALVLLVLAFAALGVLHGMNALAVAGFAGSLAGREWAAHRAAPSTA